MIKHLAKHLTNSGGFSIPLVIGMMLTFGAMGVAIASVTAMNIKYATHQQRSESALNVAEAGINYYLWHLSHDNTDYRDGNNFPTNPPYGPYEREYKDASGKRVGTFTLTITPPSPGSTVTTVQSIGKVDGLKGTRTVLAQLGQPSFSNYIFLSNTQMRFSADSTTTGPVHSNVGIEFNGTNNGPVTAAQATYNNGSSNHPGVWGTGGPQSQWQFPVPAINFNQITANFSDLRTRSQNGGVYLGSSGGIGWNIRMRYDGSGSFDLYRVNSESTSGISTTFIRNQAAPSNGIVFSAENVWVSGGAGGGNGYDGRITIAAARLPDNPTQRRNIRITGNLKYNQQDGSDAIGLISQNDVFVPRYAPNTMEVNAALLAQFGSVGYDTDNGPLKTSFTLYGAIAQNQNDYGFKVQGCGSYCRGFPITNYLFDNHLIYAPPPMFPTTGNYTILNWREVLYNP